MMKTFRYILIPPSKDSAINSLSEVYDNNILPNN